MLTQELKDSIQIVAGRLDIPHQWLEDTIFLESSYNSKLVNPIGATGLIQFTRTTAKDLGTSTEALHLMTVTEQMHYVEQYFKRAISRNGKPSSFMDFYYLCFHPPFANASDDALLPFKAYKGNAPFDINRDGKITKGEVSTSISNHLKKKPLAKIIGAVKEKWKTLEEVVVKGVKHAKNSNDHTSIIFIVGASIAALFIIYRIFRRKRVRQ